MAFPRAIDGLEGVWHLGYHDCHSFRGAAYLVATDHGHAMIDVPRVVPGLQNAPEVQTVSNLLFMHRDDVAGQQKWHSITGA